MVCHVRKGTYLGSQDDENEEKTEPRASSSEEGFERDLVKRVAVVGPGLAKSDVGVANGAPGEESSKTGKLEEPAEDGLAGGNQVHVAKGAADENGSDRKQGTAGSVNVGEDLGSVALLA